MAKSVSTLQNQISGCERSMQEAFNQCAVLTGDNNFTFQFSLNVFVKGITTADLDETSQSMAKVSELFTQCERIMAIEKKRRAYTQELRNRLHARERKETVKRLTMQHSFQRKVPTLKIPSPPSSKE